MLNYDASTRNWRNFGTNVRQNSALYLLLNLSYSYSVVLHHILVVVDNDDDDDDDDNVAITLIR